MKKIALIPARYAATRFPAKLMQLLGDKTVIRHTYDNTLATRLFDKVVVVTDHDLIYQEIISHGGVAMMSKGLHESGTDRIAEAAQGLEADIILNVQGDEPFLHKASLAQLLEAFEGENGAAVQVASLMKVIDDPKQIENPHIVKVAVSNRNDSLLFSRSVIPYHREKTIVPTYYEHIGVYAFRKEALLQFTKMPMTPLEMAEKIECLRFLENGIPLRMVLTDDAGVKIDTPEDLEKAKRYLANRG